MKTEKDDSGNSTFTKKYVATFMGIMTAVTIIVAPIYYTNSLFEHKKIPKIDSEGHDQSQFNPVDGKIVGNAPWTKRKWVSIFPAGYELECNDEEPTEITIKSVQNGDIGIELTEISSDGLNYRGKATCLEHGGTIDPEAVLNRAVDNSLLLKLHNKLYGGEATEIRFHAIRAK